MQAASGVVIGLTTEVLAPPWYEGRERYQLFSDYSACLRRADAQLLLIPGDTPVADLPTLLDRLDGVLATGGDDADLRPLGGPPPTADCKPVPASQQVMNLALSRLLLEREMPLLAVCFGMQMLGLSHGSGFEQHLDTHAAHAGGVEHEVRLASGCRLAQWLGSESLRVPSFHHQALTDAGGGPLTGTGWAADGTLEALEHPQHPFAVGVQWHPERAPDSPASIALFSRFVAAAKAYRKSSP